MTTYDVTVADKLLLSQIDEQTFRILEHRSRPGAVKRRGTLVRRALLLADVFGLALAFLVAQAFFVPHGTDPFDWLTEVALFLASLPGWVLAAKIYGLYDRDEERADHSTVDDFVRVFHLVTVCTCGLFAVVYVTGLARPTFPKLFTFWLLAVLSISALRSVARTICRRQIQYLQNAIIVGAGSVGQSIARKLLSHSEYGINVVGFVDSRPKERDDGLEHLAVLGDPRELRELIDLLDIERVIFAFSSDGHEELLELIEEVRGTDVQVDIVPRLFDSLGPSVSIHTVEGIPLLTLPPLNLSRSSLIVKRLVDLVLSTLALVACAPLLAVVALLIKLDSRGPVFYRHERIGRHREPFRLFKFRTMYRELCRGGEYGGETAEQAFNELMADPVRSAEFATSYKLQSDPRVTRLGRFLRRTSIDELPQLINVLLGHISLVGPRALTEDELDTYYGAAASDLLAIRPGVTGYWQINGRSHLSYNDRVRLDMAYVGGWSLALDLTILAKTLRVIVSRAGAV